MFLLLFLHSCLSSLRIAAGAANSLATTTKTNQGNSWTDSSYAKIIRSAEKMLKDDTYIHGLLSDVDLPPHFGVDFFVEKYPWTAKFHRYKQETEWSHCDNLKNLEALDWKGDNILGALTTFFARFQHDNLRAYKTDEELYDDAENVEIVAQTSEDIKPVDWTEANILKWMINLVIDLHYPFHFGFEAEPERDIVVHTGIQDLKLAELFEELQDEIPPPRKTSAPTEAEEEEHPIRLFKTWAKDSIDVLCKDIYGSLDVGKDTSTDNHRQFAMEFTLADKRRETFKNLLKDRMDAASKNVLLFLKSIALHRHHSMTESAQGRGKYGHHGRHSMITREWYRGAFYNGCCALLVVPSFFGLVHLMEKGTARIGSRVHML